MNGARDIDWAKLLEDLAYLEITGTALESRAGAPISYLKSVLSGQRRMNGVVGGNLLRTWSNATGKPVEFAPQRLGGSAPAGLPDIAREPEPGPNPLQRHHLDEVWLSMFR